MIEYRLDANGKPVLKQIVHRPLLYFDTWMWSLLINDPVLRNKVVAGASQLNATIMYSVATLVELGQGEDTDRIDAVAQLADKLDYGILDINPEVVIQSERRIRNQGIAGNMLEAVADYPFLADCGFSTPKRVNRIHISDIIQKLKERAAPSDYRQIGDETDKIVSPEMLRLREDAAHQDDAKKLLASRSLPSTQWPYTEEVFKRASAFLIRNKNMKLDPSVWFDAFQTVVSVSYCDFVLLDKTWCHFVRQHIPLEYPNVAKVFPQGKLPEFLGELAAFNSDSNPGESVPS